MMDQDDTRADDADLLAEDGGLPDDDALDPLGGGRKRKPLPKLPTMAPRADASRNNGDLLAYYLAEVRRFSLLEPDKEREVALSYYEAGDPQAGERLVTANLRLVVKIAFQYHRQWANVLDLIQEGNVGLVEALSRFDPYRGIRFSSYAQYWIRAYILRFLMDNFRLMRLGSTRHGRKLFFQLQKERENLLREGLQATTQRLAERLQVPESEIRAVQPILDRPAASIDGPVGGANAEEGRTWGEVLPDEQASDPEELVTIYRFDELLQRKLREFEATLEDERERAIWTERLLAHEPASLSELGVRYDVSKERIRQIETRLKFRLKTYLHEQRVEVA